MPKKIAISQSNYIPWKGYFDFIAQVDEFVLYDEVQYTKRDWRNRNRIKTPHGLKWLSIPVSGSRSQSIDQVTIADKDWNSNHWQTLRHMYGQAIHFDSYAADIKHLYTTADFENLSDINYHFLKGITKLLGIDTVFSWSSNYASTGSKSEKLISICQQASADVYVTGPAAKAYLDIALFEEVGIAVEWMNYEDYRIYPQLYGEFEHAVSVIDLLFNTGPNAVQFLKTTFEEAV